MCACDVFRHCVHSVSAASGQIRDCGRRGGRGGGEAGGKYEREAKPRASRDVENLRSSRSSWKQSRSRILFREIYLHSRTKVRTVDRALRYKIGFREFAFGLGLLGKIVRVLRHNDVPPESKMDGDRIEDDRRRRKRSTRALGDRPTFDLGTRAPCFFERLPRYS